MLRSTPPFSLPSASPGAHAPLAALRALLPRRRSRGLPPRRRPRRGSGLALVWAALGLATCLTLGLRLARERPRPREVADPSPADLPSILGAALREAAQNCLLAQELPADQPWPRFTSAAIEAALARPELEARSYGELPAIRAELGWLSELRGPADLGSRSPEDLRFLCGALHWYLEGALPQPPEPACHWGRPPTARQAELREFRGLSYVDLLSQWD